MEKKKHLIFLGMAVFIALIVTLLAYNWMQKTVKARVKPYETQMVAVAAHDLPWSTVLTKDMVRMAPFLKESLPNGYYLDGSRLLGRTMIQPIRANEPITEARLAPTSVTTGGVAAIISMNKRAMSVKVDKVVGVSGYLHPGNRVDVLVTLNQQKGEVTSPVTKIVLENILVLASGPEFTEPKKKGEKPAQVDVITLEVTPQEGEKLALAATEGKLQLALRNFSDNENVSTSGAKIPNLLGSAANAAVTKAPKAASRPVVRNTRPVAAIPSGSSGFTVEMISGTKISEQKIEKGE
jgi:pilus assembly protein CpaB